MAALDEQWKEITPAHLWPAVEHVREAFEKSWSKCSRITEVLCHAVLHPLAPKRSITDYLTPLQEYLTVVGPRIERMYKDSLQLGTPPAVFRGLT
jgi:hypothetical protein